LKASISGFKCRVRPHSIRYESAGISIISEIADAGKYWTA
jgi:hypothetical protein